MEAPSRHGNGPLERFDSLVALARHRALAQPDRLAYSFLLDGETEQARMTYAEVDTAARAIAAALQDRQGGGKRALLVHAPGLEYVCAFLGCLYAGVVAVPAYPPRNERGLPRVKAIVNDAEASFALTTRKDLAKMQSAFGALPELRRLECLATDDIAPALAEQWRPPKVGADSLAFLQYTSGSTGDPKGVILSHANLLHNLELLAAAFETSADSIGVSWLPPYHDMGLIAKILEPLYAGFPMHLMAPALFLQRPYRWLKAISSTRATYSGAPNFAFDLCTQKISAEQRAGLDLSCWRVAFNGAEPVRVQTLERFAQAFAPCGFRRESLVPCYGLAEATLWVSGKRRSAGLLAVALDRSALEQQRAVTSGAADALPLVSCGGADTDQEIAIVDPEAAVPCAEGAIGEVWVCGPSVAGGYWNRPQASEQTFRARLSGSDGGPYLRTGDLGFVKDGMLFVTGRIKDLVILAGRKLTPSDLEYAAQCSHASLRKNAGVAFAIDAEGGEQLAIVQELDFRQAPDLDAVSRAIVGAVTQTFEAAPAVVALTRPGTLPITSSGKLRRRETRDRFLRGELPTLHEWRAPSATGPGDEAKTREDGGEAAAPTRPAAEDLALWLRQRIVEKTGIELSRVDTDRAFTDFGLGSLDVVALSGELEHRLGRRLSPTLGWDYPTIGKLADFLSASGGAPAREYASSSAAVSLDPIAVVGMSCRFPGAEDVESFWALLRDGVDAITEVPRSRWDAGAYYSEKRATPGKLYSRWGGFLRQVDEFDAEFFGIAPKEAARMDPQQRLLLEVAWEAVERAGYSPRSLEGSPTGVFIGISTNDYVRRLAGNYAAMDAHFGTGNANSVAANRISYQLGLSGPSMAVDTACSSSLVAVHLGCQSLRLHECDLVLAGGVNLILEPDLTIAFSQAQMLAADGRCKTFDARADGYVRSEGCGIVVLKRLSDALRDGDQVLALVRGSAVNQNGRSNGLTAPSRIAQKALVKKALERAGVAPREVSYVEAHGTGTALGDPIEIQALVEAIGAGGREQKCAVGSAKTNIGHLESAAGIAGLIKVILMMQEREIPPHLHVKQLNPRLKGEELPVFIPGARQKWEPAAGTPRIAGVSSFGFGGANAHAVLEEAAPVAPSQHASRGLGDRERPLHLLALSGRNEAALRELAARYQRRLADHAAVRAADVCFTANAGRTHFAHRLSVIGAGVEELRAGLAAFVEGRAAPGSHRGALAESTPPKIAFSFSGTAPQAPGAGHELYRTQPTFRDALDRCDQLMRAHLPRSLLDAMFRDEDSMRQASYAQPALFAFQCALAELWRSWGIEPSALYGEGAGEYAAAWCAGVFDLADGLKLAAARGRAMQAGPEGAAWDELGNVARSLHYHRPRLPLRAGEEVMTPAYWCAHARGAVHPAERTGATADRLAELDLEIGPDAVRTGDWSSLLERLGALYVRGAAVDWAGFDRDYPRRRVVLPTYPFQRQRHWLAPSAAQASQSAPARPILPREEPATE